MTNHKPKQFDNDLRRLSIRKEDKFKIIKKYLDFGLFFDPVYLVILISNATSSISYTNFVILLPSYGVYRGVEPNLSSYLISILSLFDLIGRLGASILSDYNFMPKSFYFVGGLLVSGVALIIVPWMNSFGTIAAASALFGLSSGAVIGVTAIVMSDYLGREKLTSTYGISLFANGILQLIGPPLCAVILGDSENFQLLFILLGVVIMGGTCTWAVMPWIQSRREKNKNNKGPETTTTELSI